MDTELEMLNISLVKPTGKGFLSYVAKMHLQWEPTNPHLPKSVVVKIPHMENIEKWKEQGWSELYENTKKNFYKAHRTEVTIYKKFAMDLNNRHAEFPKLPKCYAAVEFGENGEQGYLIMEDLTESCTSTDPQNGMNLNQCLADSAEKHWESFLSWIMTNEIRIHFDEGDLDRIAKVNLPKMDVIIHHINYEHRDHGVPDVLVHADCWEHNILFNKNEDGTASDTLRCLVDWQVTHMGNPAQDLARLLATSLNADVREKHLTEILQHYYSSLSGKVKGKLPFTFDQFEATFAKTYGAFSCLVLPQYPQFMQLSERGLWAHTGDVRAYRQKLLSDAKLAMKQVLKYLNAMGP